MASMTTEVSSRAVRAPVGQCVMHWPHRAQPAASMGRPSFTMTFMLGPAPECSQTEQYWTLAHSATQRMHLMHLEASRMSGKLSSHGAFSGR